MPSSTIRLFWGEMVACSEMIPWDERETKMSQGVWVFLIIIGSFILLQLERGGELSLIIFLSIYF